MTQHSFHPSDFTIVHDPLWLDERYGVTPGIRLIMEEARPDIVAGRDRALATMVTQCRRFPDIAPLKLYLKAAYMSNHLPKKAEYVGHLMVQEHPKFLPGRIATAYDTDVECFRDHFLWLLGEQMELHRLFPERSAFHLVEVIGYYHVAFEFHLFWQDYGRAETCLRLLEQLSPESLRTHEAARIWSHDLLKRIGGNTRNIDGLSGTTFREHERDVRTDRPPRFHHPELEALYRDDFRIDRDILGHIMRLPRSTLVEDLEAMVEDAIRRYEYFRRRYVLDPDFDRRELCFPLHACYLLSGLKTETSLPVVLRFLRQGYDALDFWLDYDGEELLYEVIYHLGQHRLENLQSFVRERPSDSLMGRRAVILGVLQIAWRQPDRRIEVADWFSKLCEWFLAEHEAGKWVDRRIPTFLFIECRKLEDERLKDHLDLLYEQEVVISEVIHPSKEVRDLLAEIPPLPKRRPRPIHDNVFSWYDYLVNDCFSWDYEEPGPIEDSPLLEYSSFAEERVEEHLNWRGIWPEEPCPCGSGQAYGDCCYHKIG